MYQRYTPLLPVLALVACCTSTIVTALSSTVDLDGTTYGFTLDTKHYGTFAAAAATVVSFFWLRGYYKYFLALVFVLAFYGLINFTAIQIKAGLSFGELRIDLSPLMLLFGVLIYATNSRKSILSFKH